MKGWTVGFRMGRMVWTAALLASVGCASLRVCPPADTVGALPAPQVDAVLFLIGDAGEPDLRDGEAVLQALGAEVEAAVARHGSGRVRAVFLGDNLYPNGLPAAGSRGYEEAVRKLEAQVRIFEPLDCPDAPVGLFVPGNHDWAQNRGDGLQRILDQASLLSERSGGCAVMLPGNGCPGPTVVDFGERGRVLALDTEWWIRTAPKPEGPKSGCAAGSEEEVVDQLERHLGDAPQRRSVVVGHHPFVSGGPHGRRKIRFIGQDIVGARYQAMIAAIDAAFAGGAPLVYAAGHDHGLQVISRGALPLQLVSGAGSADNTTDVSALDDTLFCRDEPGFMRLDLAGDGRVRLAVMVPAGGAPRAIEVFSTWLDVE